MTAASCRRGARSSRRSTSASPRASAPTPPRVELPATWQSTDGAYLSLGDVLDTAKVTVNGTEITVNQSDRGRIDLGKTLRPGTNTIAVRVATTLFNAVRRAGTATTSRLTGSAPGSSARSCSRPTATRSCRPRRPAASAAPSRRRSRSALGAPASFGAFTPGADRNYDASTTATVISTAGDATLSVTDPSTHGHRPAGQRRVRAQRAAAGEGQHGAFAPLSTTAGSPLALLTYTGPVSNDAVAIGFRQHIAADQALRTGAYSKTLTFTLSTTTP